MARKAVTVRIETDILSRIDFLVRAKGMRKGDLINEALRMYLDGETQEGIWRAEYSEQMGPYTLDMMEDQSAIFERRIRQLERDVAALMDAYGRLDSALTVCVDRFNE